MAFFSNTTMKIANQDQNMHQVIECPSCRQSNSFIVNKEVASCPNCGHDIWTLEAGYYGLVDLFSGKEKWGDYSEWFKTGDGSI